jgi:hypothetical protein
MRRLAPVVVAVALLVSCLGAPAAVGQDLPVPASEQVLDPDIVVDPTTEGEAETTPELPPDEGPDDSLPAEDDAEGNTSNTEI